MPSELRLTPRYLEVDQQGVVFNMWYLAWVDDAMTGHLAACGTDYRALLESGHDCQVVRTEIDYLGPVRYLDEVVLRTTTEKVGTTSVVLRFDVTVGGETQVSARLVYVVVATDGSGKRPVPEPLRAGLLADAAPT